MATRADRGLSDEDLRQQIEAARVRLGADVKSLTRSLELEVGQAVTRGSAQIEGQVQRLGGSVAGAIEEIGVQLDHAIAQLRSHVDLRAAVRREPFKGVGIAAAIGLLGGLFFGGSRARHRPLLAAAPSGYRHPVAAAVLGQSVARVTPLGALGAVMIPLLIEIARTGAGRALESMVEGGIRKARHRQNDLS